jgi:molybdenum cofactor guanylyltransferase
MERASRTALILLGGMATRAGGRAKYLFEYEGETFLQRQIKTLNLVTDEIILSCRDEEQAQEVTVAFPYPCVIDTIKENGPVEGIRSALSYVNGDFIIIVACDMPFISAAVIEELFTRIGNADVAIPEWEEGHLEPLHAVYRREALIWFFSHHSARRMRDITDDLSTLVIPVNEIRKIDPELKTFTNINNLQEFSALIQ